MGVGLICFPSGTYASPMRTFLFVVFALDQYVNVLWHCMGMYAGGVRWNLAFVQIPNARIWRRWASVKMRGYRVAHAVTAHKSLLFERSRGEPHTCFALFWILARAYGAARAVTARRYYKQFAWCFKRTLDFGFVCFVWRASRTPCIPTAHMFPIKPMLQATVIRILIASRTLHLDCISVRNHDWIL